MVAAWQKRQLPTVATRCQIPGNIFCRIIKAKILHLNYLMKLNTERLEILAKLDWAASSAIIFACNCVIAVA